MRIDAFDGLSEVTKGIYGLHQERPIVVMNQANAHDDGAIKFDMHYELEMGLIIEGSMERFTRDSRHVCHAGEMWFTGMWEPHGFRCDGDCQRVVFLLWPPALAGFRFPEAADQDLMQPFLLPQDLRPDIPPDLRPEAIDLARYHLAYGRRTSLSRRRLFATDLLVWLFDNGLVKPSPPSQSQAGLMNITPAIELVFARNDLVTNTEAARSCGLSRDIFIRTFRKSMGVSFRQFAVRYRLSRAARLLTTTDLPVKAIAREWGFTDTSHLHRLFSQHYGCSPVAYRDKTKH